MTGLSVNAIEFDAVTEFSGSGQPSGRFYYPTRWAPDIVFGFSSVVPARKRDNGVGQEFDLDLLLGVKTNIILLKEVDIYFLFDNHDGVNRTGEYEKSEFYTRSLNVSKKWMYPLNDFIQLGMQATLAEVMLEGSKEVRIMQNINPVIGLTIKIFE